VRLTELGLDQTDRWIELYDLLEPSSTDIFDLPGYMQACQAAGHGTPVCLAVEHENSILLYPFMISKITGYENLGDIADISSPYGYGGTITNSLTPGASFIPNANKVIDEWMLSNNVVSEFIRSSPYKLNTNLRNGEYVQVRTNVQIDIPSVDEAWSNLSSSARRNIKKSATSDLSLSVDSGKAAVMEFADFYNNFAKSREWDDFYKFSTEYFQSIQENLQENMFLVKAEANGNLVAGALILKKESMSHFHLGASNPDHLGSRPNEAIFWEAIRYSSSNGVTALQLGGGTGLSPDDQLFKFKSKFGKTQLPVYIGKRVINQPAYDELIRQWATKNPDIAEANSKVLQRYRN
jgi:lipid II:glycine glycyltransferase (peptidoglycan interpeptide bridge formation enzyme)